MADACPAYETVRGYWQTSDYGYGLSGWEARATPLGEMKVSPRSSDPPCLRDAGAETRSHGFRPAWAGENEVTGIAVSTDGGQTGAEAEFSTPFNGMRATWRFDWDATKPGQYTPARPGQGCERSRPA